MMSKSTAASSSSELVSILETIDAWLRWLASWAIHNANHLRENRDGLKVGGHQVSCASISTIMTALYFAVIGPNDRVAVKRHARPILHAIHYLLNQQSLAQLQACRGFGGMQSYSSRTKDVIPVDFAVAAPFVSAFAAAIAVARAVVISSGGNIPRSEVRRLTRPISKASEMTAVTARGILRQSANLPAGLIRNL